MGDYDLKVKFAEAKVHIEALNYRPSNEDLLKLYAYYKQATEGAATGERPSGFDFKGAAKHDARVAIIGMTAEDAMKAYIELSQELLNKQ